MITITCRGAAGTVTGSNYLIEDSKGTRILVDCGLFQGGKQTEWRNAADWGFDPREIGTLLLTHAHIDHSGRIPKLVKDGFHGRIITSPPTAELCEVMLLDSGHVQEMDAEWQTRRNKRKSKKGIEPLYTVEDARASIQYLSPMEENRIIEIEPGMKARFVNAGHILGSSSIELWIEDGGTPVKIVFSGDIGKDSQLIVKDPAEVTQADYLFIESTYGNRLHRSFKDSEAELLEAIRYAVSNNEKVIIPAFAVERTQEILYILGEFQRSGSLPDIPIYLDSPLAIKATEIFRKNKEYYDEEAMAIVNRGFDPFDMPNLKFTPSTEESMAINQKSGPAIVIAGSGMCTAGRIKHHLKHNLWREGASVVIVGFQAMGTTGRRIVDGEKRVRVFGEDVTVAAKVFTIGGVFGACRSEGTDGVGGAFRRSASPRLRHPRRGDRQRGPRGKTQGRSQTGRLRPPARRITDPRTAKDEQYAARRSDPRRSGAGDTGDRHHPRKGTGRSEKAALGERRTGPGGRHRPAQRDRGRPADDSPRLADGSATQTVP